VHLSLGDLIYHQKQPIKYVYFPRLAAVSMVNIFEDGSMVEVGGRPRRRRRRIALIGDDIRPHQAIVQSADALAYEASAQNGDKRAMVN
jgi:hypothetical protein